MTPLVSSKSEPSSTPTHSANLAPFASKSKWIVTPTPTHTQTHNTSSESQRTLQSRKAAIVGTLLALGSIVGLMLFAFCLRLRRAVRRFWSKRGSTNEECGNGKDMNAERPSHSDGQEKGLASPARQDADANVDLNNVVTLPVLNAHAPVAPTSGTPTNTPQPGWNGQHQHQQSASQVQHQQHKQEWRFLSAREGGHFQDVTHILTDNATFAAHDSDSESMRISSSTQATDHDRQSHGAPSVTKSYATCESRYSTPSIQSGIEEPGTEEQTASFHSAPSRSPSPAESPLPETPKTVQQYATTIVTIKRPRSKTLEQGLATSPLKRKMDMNGMSSSKSFPARLSSRSSTEQTTRWSVLEQESEWDIAAHYGARYSGRSSTSVAIGDKLARDGVPENMEAVDIGGRSCILMQGFAF